MRHRRRGRTLGRSPSHQRALLRNLACCLFLTERDSEDDANAPKIKGRIVTTMAKAKEVRPLVERCITIARRSLSAQREADSLAPDSERQSDEWRAWRSSDRWIEWNQAIAPVLTARRRTLKLLGNKEVVRILFDEIAPRFEDRPGGYTRIMRLANPRLGDGGTRAILEFVGVRDRIQEERAETPSFEDEIVQEEAPGVADAESEVSDDDAAADASSASDIEADADAKAVGDTDGDPDDR